MGLVDQVYWQPVAIWSRYRQGGGGYLKRILAALTRGIVPDLQFSPSEMKEKKEPEPRAWAARNHQLASVFLACPLFLLPQRSAYIVAVQTLQLRAHCLGRE